MMAFSRVPVRLLQTGRPSYSSLQVWCALRRVRQMMKRFGGVPGGETMWRALNKEVPLRLVQRCVKDWKARFHAREQERIRRKRWSVKTCYHDVMWGLDGLQAGRERRAKVTAEIAKDLATLGYTGLKVCGAAKGKDVLFLLMEAKRKRGHLPLVLSVDNGSENVNRLVLDYLKKERVVVLRNLPRTPQHNGAAERAVREVRKYCGLRAENQVQVKEVEKRMREKLKLLNETLPRGSRGWKTSNELARALQAGYDVVDRDCFYQAACNAQQEAVLGLKGARAVRLAERMAIMQTLVRFGLAEITRGGVPIG
ncbi:MAG: DDE-type integrase/transposase/recombinase [Planctomycetes bacterium]|nr:DDE-type integrase/transposase/recombinase [Planctomycetota bacterium]